MAHGADGHARTLTSMLGLDPIREASGGSFSGAEEGLQRAQSFPSASTTDLQHTALHPHIVSAPLTDTHAERMAPPLLHSQSDCSTETPAQSTSLSRQELKAFDPLAVISPEPANLSPPVNEVPSSAALPVPIDLHAAMHAPMTKSAAAGAAAAAAPSPFPSPSSAPPPPIQSGISIGHDQTISSINSYSSSALSSGTFVAYSVSPVQHDLRPQMPTTATTRNNLPHTVALDAMPNAAYSNSHAAHQFTSPPSLTNLAAQHLAHLTVSSPSSEQAAGSPLDSSTSRASVRFSSDPPDRSSARSSIHPPASETPSMVRVHDEDDAVTPSQNQTPNFIPEEETPSGVALHSALSPSFPHTPDCLSPHPDDLPPVVTALMAAQKVAGTTPGATLSMPAQSATGRLVFICGDASGAGKSSVAMGLLHLFLKRGYEPKELAYIKPCTQCEDVQLISKYCASMGIAHQGLGPVIFYEGFTSEVIDGTAESVEKRRGRIQKAVNKIAEGKKWVLVDGVGYAAVGSVAGVSNAEVASLLHAPVLVVGRPGIGNAIDSMNFILAYFEKYHVHTLGACWNKIPPMHSYHSYDKCKAYVNKYFREIRPGVLSTYGHIPLVDMQVSGVESSNSASSSASSPPPAAGSVSCRLRPAKTDLQMTPAEDKFVGDFLGEMERCFDIEQFLGDLQRYYQAHRVLWSDVAPPG